MIILRFGTSGRLAGICRTATRVTHPDCPVVAVTRDADFRREDGSAEYKTLDAVMRSHPGKAFLVLDASVDHDSADALVAHESFKRDCIATLARRGLLWRCVGFSSGITLIDAARVRPTATHMLEYRRQKILQEELFLAIGCPFFLPHLFTIVGPRTYARQSAAWAQILRSRMDRKVGVILNEPHARKAWASEFEVLNRLLRFLSANEAMSATGPLVEGDFSLHEIARCERLPMPELDYGIGNEPGWLSGDYLPASTLPDPRNVTDELLRAISAS